MEWKRNRLMALLLMVVMIFSLMPASTEAANPFKDVKPGHWALESVGWAHSQGLTNGYPDGTFAPDKPITEAQFVTMLVRFDCTAPDAFPALKGEHKSSGNYRYLASKHIPLEGTSRTFARDWVVKKGTAARIIAAFNGYDLSEAQAVYYLFTEDLATGRTGKNTFKDFGANDSLTRAEAVELLHRLSKTGSCDLVGLKKKAAGSDNSSYQLPQNFKDDGTVFFPAPGGQTKPPVFFNPQETAEIDVEKRELIANGVDSTYVTVSFRACNGETIPYDRSLAVRVTSSAGATLVGDNYDEKLNDNYYSHGRTSIISGTDGPDITVKVIAPTSKTYLNDTITFELLDQGAFWNTACLTKPININLSYVPKAEVRLEEFLNTNRIIGYKLDGTPIYERGIRATLVLPGGQIVRNFNGSVRFHTTGGSRVVTNTVPFQDGVTTTPVYPIQTTEPTRDVIIAEVIPSNSRYPSELIGVLNETHSIEVLHDSKLRVNPSCSAEMPEMAFIIDSSGSMKKNDRNRLRVSKTEEMIESLQAPSNVATAFNSSARLLEQGNWVRVKSKVYQVGQSGGTNIGAGMNNAFSNMNSNGRKVAILLTDGKSSERQIESALTVAQEKGITVFTIGLGNETNLNTALLKKIAADTGGSYYHISDSIDLGLVYQSILDEITCGVKLPTCSSASQMFVSPSVKITNSDVFMETDIRETCGEIAKVIVRFESAKGYIDYELVHRGQNNYRFIRGVNEIQDIQYYREAQFLAYDRNGYQIGAGRTVNIVNR